MFPIQPRRRGQRDEKLTAIRVGPTVCHAQNPRTCMLQARGNLILKLLAVDGTAATPCACGVATLNHETRYYAVEYCGVVVATLGQAGEVLAGFGCVVFVEFDGDEALRRG
jgi:hypothetical protein